MRRSLSVFALSSLVLAAGCSIQGSDSTKTKTIDVAFCESLSGTFIDLNEDGQFDIGDSAIYKIKVASSLDGRANCKSTNGTFYGLEEIVDQRLIDGEKVFLTNAQGTFMLPEGNLQTRATGHLVVGIAMEQGDTQSAGKRFTLGDLFPAEHDATVFGQGGTVNGYVGVAKFMPGIPPRAQLSLFNRFAP